MNSLKAEKKEKVKFCMLEAGMIISALWLDGLPTRPFELEVGDPSIQPTRLGQRPTQGRAAPEACSA